MAHTHTHTHTHTHRGMEHSQRLRCGLLSYPDKHEWIQIWTLMSRIQAEMSPFFFCWMGLKIKSRNATVQGNDTSVWFKTRRHWSSRLIMDSFINNRHVKTRQHWSISGPAWIRCSNCLQGCTVKHIYSSLGLSFYSVSKCLLILPLHGREASLVKL